MQRQLAYVLAVALLATGVVDVFAEPEMTFKVSGVRPAASAAFQSEMRRARV